MSCSAAQVGIRLRSYRRSARRLRPCFWTWQVVSKLVVLLVGIKVLTDVVCFRLLHILTTTTTLDLCNELLDIAKCRGDSQAERGQLGMRRVTKQRHIPLTYSFV